MEMGKRRAEEGELVNDREKRGKAKEEEEEEVVGGVNIPVPPDEEVEEFFAILRRIRVAVQYFKERNGRGAAAMLWQPSFERADFESDEVDSGKEKNRNEGLDLNVVPVSEPDESSSVTRNQ